MRRRGQIWRTVRGGGPSPPLPCRMGGSPPLENYREGGKGTTPCCFTRKSSNSRGPLTIYQFSGPATRRGHSPRLGVEGYLPPPLIIQNRHPPPSWWESTSGKTKSTSEGINAPCNIPVPKIIHREMPYSDFIHRELINFQNKSDSRDGLLYDSALDRKISDSGFLFANVLRI